MSVVLFERMGYTSISLPLYLLTGHLQPYSRPSVVHRCCTSDVLHLCMLYPGTFASRRRLVGWKDQGQRALQLATGISGQVVAWHLALCSLAFWHSGTLQLCSSATLDFHAS